MSKKNFIYGSLLLAVVNFIVRAIGFCYRIILSKLIGPEGIGLFQMIFPILMVFITMTTSGIPIAVSRLVSKYKSLNKKENIHNTFKISLIIVVVMSFILASILIVFNEFITHNILKNDKLHYCILFLAPAIIIISISSLMRGYFYGMKWIKSAGVAQVIEQLTRIAFVIGIIILLYPVQSNTGALIAVWGISIGEFCGLLWLLRKYRLRNTFINRLNKSVIKNTKLISEIIYVSLPITITRLINVSLGMINTILIPRRLMIAGLSSTEAIGTLGRVSGMTMPFIFMPFIITSALVINLIPNISEEMAVKNYRNIRSNIELSIKITLLVSIPLAGIYTFFPYPIAQFIYNDYMVGKYLSILGLSTVFLSLYHTLSGILHGLGKQIAATVNYIAGMSIQLFATYYLVSNPQFGIYGYFIGFIVATYVIGFLDLISINKAIKIKMNIIDSVLKPIISAVICTTVTLYAYNYFGKVFNVEVASLIISIFLGIISYITGLIITRSITIKQIKKLLKKG